MTQQPNGGDLHPRVEAMERLRNGGGMTGLEKGVPEEIHGDAYVSQDERDMINHFSRIDSMNLSQKAREMLKEDYLRNRTGAAKTVQEVGDTYPDVEFQESVAEEDNLKTKLKKYSPFLLDPTGFNRKLHGGTYNAIKTWMGMPRDK